MSQSQPWFMESELAAELYVDEVVDGSGRLLYVDKVVSVSEPLSSKSMLEKRRQRSPENFRGVPSCCKEV